MTAVIHKLAEMVLMILIGYISAKLKVSGPEFNRATSAVLTNVLLPATILKSMAGVETGVQNSELVFVIGLFFLMMGIAWAGGKLTAKLLPLSSDERGVILCVVMYMNLAFVGFPLVESYYGSQGMFYACLSCVPMNMLMFSAGISTISGGASGKIQLKQLFNIPLVTTVIGIVFMMLEINLPVVVDNTINALAGATIPMSMLILGSSLAATSVKSAFDDWRIYIAVFARLILCPIITNLLFRLITDNAILLGTVTILASTPVAVLITPLCVQYGKNEQLASKSIFISTVLSVITMPMIIWLLL